MHPERLDKSQEKERVYSRKYLLPEILSAREASGIAGALAGSKLPGSVQWQLTNDPSCLSNGTAMKQKRPLETPCNKSAYSNPANRLNKTMYNETLD